MTFHQGTLRLYYATLSWLSESDTDLSFVWYRLFRVDWSSDSNFHLRRETQDFTPLRTFRVNRHKMSGTDQK